MKRSRDLTESNAFCNNRFIPQQPYHKCDQSNRVYTNLNIISDDSVGFLLGSYDASAGWALQAYWPSYCSFRISLNNMVPLNSVCAYNTQSFFYSLFYLYWVFMASILFKCTIDLIFLLHLFCRDLLYKPVVICKISFFFYIHITAAWLCHTLQNSFIIYRCSMWPYVMFLVCPQSYACRPGITLCCV